MKIICKRGYPAGKMLQAAEEYIERMGGSDSLLEDDVEITLSMQTVQEKENPEHTNILWIGQEEMDQFPDPDTDRDYYNKDVLTGLYNRSRYERDLALFQSAKGQRVLCIYADAVGLHEINNHLGHQAGDDMLCCIADGIRHAFPKSPVYRIGGDEFVVLSMETGLEEAEEKISVLKESLRKRDYEISVGAAESPDGSHLNDAVNRAENTMRHDKADFYRNHGGLRQMRSLNHKLEKLLLEKQDASHFLNVIAPQYKGVYMVNTEKDTCRYIYVPPYFQTMLDRHQGCFSRSLQDYCRELVRQEDRDRIEQLLNYGEVRSRLALGQNVGCVYQKCDGSRIDLRITSYAQDSSDNPELLWIFMDENEETA